MTRWMVAFVALCACACARAESFGPDPGEAIHAMLGASAEAWNRGDLDAFVSDYARDSTTGFVSGGRVQYGFDWIREHYAPLFEPGASRDSLRFENLAAHRLGTNYAFATARFVLFRAGHVTSSGPFTLILTNTAGRWKIVHDHTSSDQ